MDQYAGSMRGSIGIETPMTCDDVGKGEFHPPHPLNIEAPIALVEDLGHGSVRDLFPVFLIGFSKVQKFSVLRVSLVVATLDFV